MIEEGSPVRELIEQAPRRGASSGQTGPAASPPSPPAALRARAGSGERTATESPASSPERVECSMFASEIFGVVGTV